MLCDRCGKNPSVIHIAGKGNYCADCNNQMMLEMFGKDNTFHYAKNIIISETAPSTLRGVSATWHCNARDGCGPHRSAPRRSEALLGQIELAATV